MCGVIGIFSNQPVAVDVVRGLNALQHRGIQSSGLIIYDSFQNIFTSPIRGVGASTDVFRNVNIHERRDNVAIGHNRYATSGDDLTKDAQPLYIQKPGLALAHNGQISNYVQLRKRLEEQRSYTFFTNVDAEALLFAFAQNLIELKSYKAVDTPTFVREKCFPALEKTMNPKSEYAANGAFSAVAIIANRGLLAFKDPHGIRPLCFAKKDDGALKQYAFASETTAFHFLKGFQEFHELAPGEAIFIDFDFNIYHNKIQDAGEKNCPFEAVYFSQVDSNYRGNQVYDLRFELGLVLAENFPEMKDCVDVVIPVPKSPIPAAIALANAWEKPYGGIVPRPSHSSVRAFQQDGKKREKSIDDKLLFVRSHIQDKRIALIDDSIVRGETSKKIVKRLFSLGATEVHLFSTFPPYIGICPFGIDTPTEEELLVNANTKEDIEIARREIGATTLHYLSSEKMLKSVNLNSETACLGCTTKQYPIDIQDYSDFQLLRKKHREIAR